MEEKSSSPRIVRFGAFELDLRAGELHRNGLKIKLQEQPFQVLAMLLRHPGEAVTREELQKTVWPADTFVDFDRGLNKTINKIREALGDSADNPRFVETLPRRGYRFIAAVDVGAVRKPPLQGIPVPSSLLRHGKGDRAYLFCACAASPILYLRRKRSTRPPVSTIRCLPV